MTPRPSCAPWAVLPVRSLTAPAPVPHTAGAGEEARPQTTEQAIREAHRILAAAGITLGASKVAKLCRSYVTAAPHMPLRVYLANNLRSEPLARRLLVGSDPTGNVAASNVDRERGAAHV